MNLLSLRHLQRRVKEVVAIAESKKPKYAEPHLTEAGLIFCNLLKRARQEKGWSQTELAERLGMSQVLISRGELGARKIDALELRQMCAALEVDLIECVKQLDAELSDYESNPKPVYPPPVERTRTRR